VYECENTGQKLIGPLIIKTQLDREVLSWRVGEDTREREYMRGVRRKDGDHPVSLQFRNSIGLKENDLISEELCSGVIRIQSL
jgi:hypothetical protein